MKSGRRGTIFYWDTWVFLHWMVDPVKDKSVVDGIEDIVKMSERGDATIFTSTITRVEVLRSHMTSAAADAFIGLFPRAVEWVNVDPRIAELAHDIRSFYSEPGKREMGTVDCIHLATAIIYEANEMNTGDGDGKRKRHTLIPLSGNVMDGKYKIVIRKPVRMPVPPSIQPLF
jgi:predicted nucleic acid-binding protein